MAFDLFISEDGRTWRKGFLICAFAFIFASFSQPVYAQIPVVDVTAAAGLRPTDLGLTPENDTGHIDKLVNFLSKQIDWLQSKIMGSMQVQAVNGSANAMMAHSLALALAGETGKRMAAATPPDSSRVCAILAFQQNENQQSDTTDGIDQAQIQAWLVQGRNSATGAQAPRTSMDAISVCRKIGPNYTFINGPYADVTSRFGTGCKGQQSQ